MLRNVAIGVLCLAAGGVGAAVQQRLAPAHPEGGAASAPSIMRTERTLIVERTRTGSAVPSAASNEEFSSEAPSNLAPPPSETVEEANARIQAEHEALRSRFEEEPIDPTWSTEKQNAISTKLRDLGEKGGNFTLQAVECQTTLCRGTVRFSGRQEALDGWRRVLHMPSGCASEVLVQEEEVEPFDLEVYYDCGEERAKG